MPEAASGPPAAAISQAAAMVAARPTSRARGTSPLSIASRRRFSVGSSVFCSWSWVSDMAASSPPPFHRPPSQPAIPARAAVTMAPAVTMKTSIPPPTIAGVATK